LPVGKKNTVLGTVRLEIMEEPINKHEHALCRFSTNHRSATPSFWKTAQQIQLI
jgi:hypothetical protein